MTGRLIKFWLYNFKKNRYANIRRERRLAVISTRVYITDSLFYALQASVGLDSCNDDRCVGSCCRAWNNGIIEYGLGQHGVPLIRMS